MDNASWPTDNRPFRKDVGQKKGERKTKEKKSIRDYPCLQHGSLNALTLSSNTSRLEWTTVTGRSKGKKLVPLGDAKEIFPSTRPLPLQIPKYTVSQRAEQGAHFLRTYFPDIEIPAELIRDEINAETRVMRQLEKYDPYAGNLLDIIICEDGPRHQKAFLCFPMGESNRDLNISPFALSQTGETAFEPIARAKQTFPTPIQQIVSSSWNSSHQGSYLAVRSLASISLFEVRVGLDGSLLSEKACIDNSDTNGRPIIDVKISPSKAGIVVNDHGAVYKCDFGNGWKSLQCVYTHPMTAFTPDNLFWRLSFTDQDNGCIFASDKCLKRLDLRTSGGHSTELFSFQDRGDLVTSIEGPQADHLIRLCSTTELLWIDNRFTRSPLLGYKHGRSFDRTLETRTVLLPTPHTFLMSRKNSMMTVYDVSRSDDGLIRSNVPAYSLPPMSGDDVRNTGHLILQHPNNVATVIYQLTERGSIYCRYLDFPPGSQVNADQEVCEWPTDVQNLAREANFCQNIGLLGSRSSNEVDLQHAYRKIFDVKPNAAESVVDAHPVSLNETLDTMALFWRDSDPIDHILTVYDIAFHCSDGLIEPSRAKFLTQSDVNCREGYQALQHGRIPCQTLIQNMSWHYNIAPALSKFDSVLFKRPQALLDHLRQYNLASDLGISPSIEADASEQLALDLTLSMDVLSPRPFSNSANDNLDALETMSRAAEAMSLTDEPPPIYLGYLQRKMRDAMSHRGASRPTPLSQELDGPMGVQLLLKEWDVGTDPRDYTYADPYNDLDHGTTTARRLRSPLQSPQTVVLTQSQRPPLVIASKPFVSQVVPFPAASKPGGILKPASGMPILRTGSQSIVRDLTFNASQQDYMASTQILPGPHGGRQSTKKSTKKRLGGF